MFSYLKKIFKTKKCNLINNHFRNLERRIEEMALNLDALAVEVTRVQTVQASAVSLLKNLTVELESISAELAKKNAEVPQPIDTSALDNFVGKLKDSTDSLASAVADSANVIPHHEVVLNADNPTVPTVSVVMPAVVPEHVEVTAEKLTDEVKPDSPIPQIAVVVTEDKTPEAPATEPEVKDVIKTEDNLVDVNMTAPVAQVDEMKKDGVDVMDAVKTAYEASPEVTAAPAETPVE